MATENARAHSTSRTSIVSMNPNGCAISDVCFSHGDLQLVRDFSTVIMRGDKIGIIGANGIGKSTLIKLLLGELTLDSGTIKTGTNIEIAYFDQLRGTLRTDLTAMENVCEGRDTVTLNGAERHIISYMQDFLFAPERARAPITALSGGETNRLMLAKLILKPSNLLILDEPTNDLDAETLELLESLLAEYQGTVIIISHDRESSTKPSPARLCLNDPGSFANTSAVTQTGCTSRAPNLNQLPARKRPALMLRKAKLKKTTKQSNSVIKINVSSTNYPS